MPKYIYETPDNGKTIYFRPADNPDAKRELVPQDESCVETFEGIPMVALVPTGVKFSPYPYAQKIFDALGITYVADGERYKVTEVLHDLVADITEQLS